MPKTKSGITQKSQELKGLLTEVENTIDFKPKIYSDYEKLKELIDKRIHTNSIGESTLKRLWSYEKNYKPAFDYTILNLLATVADYKDWEEYINTISSKIDLTPIFDDRKINDAEKDLKRGDIITLGWYPERYARVEYLEGCEFKIIEYKGRGKDLTNEIINARWFEIVPEWINNSNGHGYSMYSDIVAVLGDTHERLYL